MEALVNPVEVLTWGLTGTFLGLLLSWIPGLHIFNLLVLVFALAPGFITSNIYALPYFALGAVVGFSFASSIASTYLSVSDESMMLMLFPSQRYLLAGRGHRAVLLYLIGALIGAVFLAAFMATIGVYAMPVIYNLFSPYYWFILLAIVVFMFMSEYPKEADHGRTPREKLWLAWRQVLGGVLVFFASGILGFIASYSGLLRVEAAYARLTPLFIGFFGFPWVLRNLISKRSIPRQDTRDFVETSPGAVINGSASGIMGGGIAAFFPIITGGMGALVGGHMASSRGDDAFLISQGAARTVYYTGALFFLFHPTMRITRGAVAWLVGGVYTPKTWAEFYVGAAFIILAAALSFAVTLYLSKAVAWLLTRISYVYISAATLAFLVGLVFYLTGPVGVALMLAATSVGFAAMVFNTRLSYCLGSLILPVLANTMGFAGFFFGLLGLGG
ncbi:tripartite tricarboxylate transporter permease [Thermosphaera sp.]